MEKHKPYGLSYQGSGIPYYVQTPSFWFPLEPHFRQVGFQWLPESMRARRQMRKKLGFREKCSNWDLAMASIESVKLLTYTQMAALFPDPTIYRERVGPLTKSYMAIKEPPERQ